MKRVLVLLLFFVSFSRQGLAQFSYEQFHISDLSDLKLVNNATLEGNKIRLTLNSGNQVGACWFKAKQQVDRGFETEFSFQITDLGGYYGGDGFAFVIQNHAEDAIGETGGAIGYGGIPNCLAVEFDTWDNYGDPNSNHISIQTKGTEPNDADQSASLGYTTEISDLSDGEIHRVKLTYSPPLISVYVDSLDSLPVLSVNVSLEDTLQLDEGRAWVGFTGATGSAAEKHYIISWQFTPQNAVAVKRQSQPNYPQQVLLAQNYPNPFNPTTTINYALPKASRVELTIYNTLGQKVRTLVQTLQPAGRHSVQWNGRDDAGRKVTSGVYVYRLKAGYSFVQTKKMIYLK